VNYAAGTVISSNYVGDSYTIGIADSAVNTGILGNTIVRNGVVDHEQGGMILDGSNSILSKQPLAW
jgi:hypothetical protein